MKFGATPLGEALGAILAHGLKAGTRVFKKGRVLSADDLAALKAAGLTSVVTARLEAGDVGENLAAGLLAQNLVGGNIRAAQGFTGRANLFAEKSGLCLVDRDGVDRFNAIDALSRDLLVDGKPGLAIYGAAELAHQLFAHTAINEGRIAAIFDSDPHKVGRDFGGLPVRPPSDIPVLDPAAIVILSGAETDIRGTIAQQGYRGRTIGWSEILPLAVKRN